MRKLLAGTALLLLSLFINQLAASIDFSYGVLAAVLAGVIGYGLLVTSQPMRRIWRRGIYHMQMTIVVSGIITGLVGAGVTWLLIMQEEHRASRQQPQAKRELVNAVRHLLGQGESLRADYYRQLGTTQQPPLAIRDIEAWRTTVGDKLNAPPLRNSGATEYVLTLGGDRITEPLQRLREVLASLDKWIAQGSPQASKEVSGLSRLRDVGVALRNRAVRTAGEYAAFRREYDDWDRAVVAEMRRVEVRESDVAWFKTLDLVPPIEFPHQFNGPHGKDLRELSEKLRRLLEIMQRHDRG